MDLDLPWRFVPWVIVAVLLNGQRPADPVEVACLPIEGGHPQPPQTWLVQPPQPISGFVTSTHGISHKDVEDAPQFSEIAEQVRTAMAGRVVVGHHLHVDLDVLARAFGSGWRPSVSVNTMRLAIASWPGRPSYRLQVLTEHLDAQLPASARRHRAGPAAVLTTALFLELVQAIARGKGRTPSAGELVTRALPPQLASAAWSRPGGVRCRDCWGPLATTAEKVLTTRPAVRPGSGAEGRGPPVDRPPRRPTTPSRLSTPVARASPARSAGAPTAPPPGLGRPGRPAAHRRPATTRRPTRGLRPAPSSEMTASPAS